MDFIPLPSYDINMSDTSLVASEHQYLFEHPGSGSNTSNNGRTSRFFPGMIYDDEDLFEGRVRADTTKGYKSLLSTK